MITLANTDTERLLRAGLGSPINPVPSGPGEGQDNKKVLGFDTPDGRVLALDRETKGKTRIWFQPPEPPALDGVVLRPTSPINANLSGRLAVLNNPQRLQVEVTSVVLDRGGAVLGIRTYTLSSTRSVQCGSIVIHKNTPTAALSARARKRAVGNTAPVSPCLNVI